MVAPCSLDPQIPMESFSKRLNWGENMEGGVYLFLSLASSPSPLESFFMLDFRHARLGGLHSGVGSIIQSFLV